MTDSEIELQREQKMREMYSRIRYPGLDSESSPEYVHHRRFVYGLLGLDVDSFFRGKTILDAGCGTGEETLFLASLGPAEIIGIDMSEGSLDHARSMAEKHGLRNVEFRTGSVLDRTVFPDALFDFVSSLGCIHHTPDTRAAFANLCRMVKPGGHLSTFIYNTFGHLVYNIQCGILDRLIGDDVDGRVRWARRLFARGGRSTSLREGVPFDSTGKLYDKYGVLYRDSRSLRALLTWHRDEGFTHVGSYPMFARDIIDGLKSRSGDGVWPPGVKGGLARTVDFLLSETPSPTRTWTLSRRFAMQLLLLGIGVRDYGSAFRMLAKKGN